MVIAPGIEVREMALPVASLLARGTMIVVRLDPATVTLRVHYVPGEARSLAEWQEALPEARIIVNGAFFDEANRALGLLVSDGQAYGQSFIGFGGMLQVDGAGMRVRSLVTEPYQGEALWQAVQAFPLLLEGGDAGRTRVGLRRALAPDVGGTGSLRTGALRGDAQPDRAGGLAGVVAHRRSRPDDCFRAGWGRFDRHGCSNSRLPAHSAFFRPVALRDRTIHAVSFAVR